jgi:DNA-binding MarR family transcriptional regulator
MSIDSDEKKRLEDAKRANVGQMLVRAARLWNELALARLRGIERYADIRASHLALLPYLDWEGSRLTDLAARVGVTKQAVQPLIDDLERMGVVERIADSADARARLVRLRPEAALAIADGLRVLSSVEADIAAELGPDVLSGLLPGLLQVVSVLERHVSGRES